MKRKPATLLILVAGVAALTLVGLRRLKPVPPPLVLHPTVRQLAAAQYHIQALQAEAFQPEAPPKQAVQTKARPSRAPAAPVPRTLRISEDDLNVYLAGSQSVRNMLAARGVQAVQIVLSEPANLTLHAAVTLHGQSQNVQFDGVLTPDPKLGLRYTARQAQVGRFPLPPSVVTVQADALAARFFAQMHDRLPLAIQSIQVQGKMLILTGIPLRREPTRPKLPSGSVLAFPPPMSPVRH